MARMTMREHFEALREKGVQQRETEDDRAGKFDGMGHVGIH